MKHLIPLLMVGSVLVACTLTLEPTFELVSPRAVPTSPVSHGGPVTDYVSLLDDLRAGGTTVEPAGSSSSEFFSVPRLLIIVNGEQVEVLEYPDAATAEKEAAYISPDGRQIHIPGPTTADGEHMMSVSIVEWVATPHFFRNGRLIVQYIGDNLDVISALEGVLGPQFAGGQVHVMLPIPAAYKGVLLPGGGGTRREGTAPPAWLVVGSEAVPGTVAAATEEGVIADPAEAVPDLPGIPLPAGAETVIVIGSDGVDGFQAVLRPWIEGSTPLFDPSGTKLDAAAQPAQSMAVLTLSPVSAEKDLLLRADIIFPIPSGTGSASYIWRLSPAPAATAAPITPIAPSVTATAVHFLSWSPDGEFLAYLEHTLEDVAVLPPFPPGTLKFLNVRTGQTCDSSIVFPDGQYDRLDRIAWLPDGQFLVIAADRFQRGTPCASDFTPLTDLFSEPVYEIVASDLARSRFLINGEQGYWLYEPEIQLVLPIEESVQRDWRNGYAWSPASDRLAIASVRDMPADFKVTTYAINARTGQVEDAIESTLRAGLGDLPGPLWLSEDQFLIQETLDQGPLLVTVGERVSQVAPDLFGLRSVPSILDSEEVGLYATAAFLAGTETYHLVLAGVGVEANLPSLQLYHSETGDVEELPFRHTGGPTFSPDGRWLVLDARPIEGGYEGTELWLRQLDPAGSEAYRLIGDVPSSPAWSSDWANLAIESPAGISIFSIPDGAPLGSWGNKDYHLFPLSWSPNSEFLVAHGTLHASQGEALFVLPAGNGPSRQASNPTTTYTDHVLGFAFDMPKMWEVDSYQGAAGHIFASKDKAAEGSILTFSVVGEGDLDFALSEVKRGAWGPYIRQVQPVRLGEFQALRLELTPADDRPSVVWLLVTPSGHAVGFFPGIDLTLVEPVLSTLRAVAVRPL